MIAIATISLALSGCRSGNPIRSTVQVTEDPSAVVADLPAPEQRLATSTTGKERGLVKVTRDSTKANLASNVQNKPTDAAVKPPSGQETTSPHAKSGPPQTQMSLTDASPHKRATNPTPATDVDVSAAGLVSASLSDLSETHQSNRPSDSQTAVAARPVASPRELANASSQRRPATQRRSFNQTELPHALTAAIEQSLNELPALPDSRMVAGDLAPVRLGTGADQLAQLDELRSDPQSESLDLVAETSIEDAPVDDPVTSTSAIAASNTAASNSQTGKPAANNPVTSEPVANERVINEAVAKVPLTDDSLASQPAVGEPLAPPPSNTQQTPATEPRLAARETAQDDPSVVMNANQVQPASHAGEAGKLEVASHQQVADDERIAPEVVTPEAVLAELSETQLYQQLLDRISQPQEGESPTQRERRQIVMRHLMVLAGQPESAIESMQGLNPTEQLYLKNHLMGLWTMIDPEGHPSSGRRITEALPKFREATRHMATATDSLSLNSLEFCTEIESYGQIKPFEGNRFVAGQQVILYCEIENFAAEDHSGYFQTRLQGSYDIYNADGTKVISQLLPVDQQRSRNRLRDYFVAYQMNLPKGLPQGTYRLQLTIEDVVGKKYGQSSIPFEIR